MVGTMYKFTKKSDTEYEIKSLAKNKGSYDEYFTEDSVTSIKDGKVVGAKNTWRMADEGVIFVKTNDETKVLTGKQVKAWSDLTSNIKSASALADKSSGYYYAKVGAINLGVKDIPALPTPCTLTQLPRLLRSTTTAPSISSRLGPARRP